MPQIRNRPKTGVDQTSHLVKMVAILVGPFVVVFFAIQFLVPFEWSYLADVFIIIGWLMYCVMLYTNEKSKVTSYLPFPQSHWRFPDGQQTNFDLQVVPADEGGYESIKKYPDGSELYRVLFKDYLGVQEKDRKFPDVFNYALWKVPASWTESFSRNGHGEFFAGTLFVDHPACENIEVDVMYWDQRENYRVPVCLITACSYTYRKALEKAGTDFNEIPTMTKPECLDAVATDLKNENSELWTRNLYLEQENERLNVAEPTNVQKLTDKRMAGVVKRHKSIMNIEIPRWKFINLKTLAICFILGLVLLVTTHFVWGWP